MPFKEEVYMIKLLRVDHRLLHGQVAFSWTKQLGADCILIADDEVVQDELRMTALRMSKPNGIKLVMKSIDDSIKSINCGITDKYKLFIIVGNLESASRLVKGCNDITSINLGGLKKEENKKQISKAISVDDHDICIIKQLHASGITLEIRMVPNDDIQDPMDLL